jgi:hypothetical protein
MNGIEPLLSPVKVSTLRLIFLWPGFRDSGLLIDVRFENKFMSYPRKWG